MSALVKPGVLENSNVSTLKGIRRDLVSPIPVSSA